MNINLDFWKTIEPKQLFRAVGSKENREFVVATMRRLALDPIYTRQVIDPVSIGQIETRCFTSWLACELRPNNYLEVGVRRGFSTAMLVSRCPQADVYGFDLWLRDYAGVPNPGPRFVQSQMNKIGYKKRIHFISGNTHKTLPAFFGGQRMGLRDWFKGSSGLKERPSLFDMILIDGDHTLVGAFQDLCDTMPHCAVGGSIIFDDIAPDLSGLSVQQLQVVKDELGDDPHGMHNLLGVWHAIQEKFHNFRYFEFVDNAPGVGLAIRLE